MITFSNLLVDSMIRARSDLWNDRNEYALGPIKVVQGRYYLIVFALYAVADRLPKLYSAVPGDGVVATLINSEIILTSDPALPPYTAKKALGVFLYGGYCTETNPNWSFVVNFGSTVYCSFAYSIDEAQGTTSTPVIRSTALPSNIGTISAAGFIVGQDASYMVGASTISKEEYEMVLSPEWNTLSVGYAENVVPNLITGYSPAPVTNLSWTEVGGAGQEGPYMDRAIIACELT